MRLNAYLARAGIASRRGADKLIKAGKVLVNGRPGKLNDNVSEADEILVEDKKISAQKLRYILFYKPERTVTTLDDPEGRAKVTDLVDIPERVIPVGRLDYDTTGALLLTNDGELAHSLMHPSFEVDKVYEAEVKGVVTKELLNKLRNGVELEDGMTSPAQARLLPGGSAQTVEIIIHEGRKHQVKRMLAAIGLPVAKLHRTRYGSLSVEGLKPGQWRELTAQEVNQLKNGTIAG